MKKEVPCSKSYYVRIIFFIIFLASFSIHAQEEAWFYFRAQDTTFTPSFEKKGEFLHYTGDDDRLKAALQNYKIKTFKKTYRKAKKQNLKRTFFVIANNKAIMIDLLQNTSHIFESGEVIATDEKKIFEPNDYGLTSTITDNEGFEANLDYLDFLGLPEAWYYTTGDRKTIVGISDGAIDTTNVEFKNKIKVFHKTQDINGHGTSVASIAAGQGDNGYGIPGVCYDCSIYSTFYGRFRTFDYMQELSKAGARVINCSWAGRSKYENVQQEINEMFARGTIVVASAGNNGWDKNTGKLSYNPASYENVISVSSVNYKYETINENIEQTESGLNYINNIRGYVGRTGGFKNNDISSGIIHTYPISVTTLNKDVDILAPSTGVLSFANSIKKGKPYYITIEATSPAAPLVSGTIGLLFSLYPCLPTNEVESILKMTATNIDTIEANKPYTGMYGAGMLNTGRAVKMVFDMYAEKESVTIQNQRFSRWDFKLTSISDVLMQNQEFTENATLNLISKKRITISKNTVLKPNANGKIHLKINPSLKKDCELQLRDPSILND